MPVLVSATARRKPVSFPRSNTTVSNDEVVIGERHFPMNDISGAHVWDITAGKHLVELERRRRVQRVGQLLTAVATVGFVIVLFLGLPEPVRASIYSISVIIGMAGYLLTTWVTPGYRPYFRRHKYYLTLNTRSGAEDVITGFDLKHLDEIAREINIRSTGNDMLVGQGT